MGKGRDKRRKLKARQAPALTRVNAGDAFTLEDVRAAVKTLEQANTHPDANGDYIRMPLLSQATVDKIAAAAAREDLFTPELAAAAMAMGPTPEGALIVSPQASKRCEVTELQLQDFTKVNHYGLTHSGYRATVSDGDLARITALACEGAVWQRHWGIQIDKHGRVVEMKAPHTAPPCYAWLGDYNTGIITNEVVRAMADSLKDQGAMEPGKSLPRYVMGEDGRLSPVN